MCGSHFRNRYGSAIRNGWLRNVGIFRHLRKLLIESAQCFARGQTGHISVKLKQRQALCSSDIVAYANKANERLRRRYYKMIGKGKKYNIVKTAIARELACFIWGMMTDNIQLSH